MCSHYQALKERAKFERQFSVKLPPYTGVYDMWPGYEAPFVRRPPEFASGDEAVPEREVVVGRFGLIPHWAKDDKFCRRTFNARSETASTLPSFRDAWRQGQRCIIPAEAIFEPDWRSGKAVATRISRTDGDVMGIAGLWARWRAPTGVFVHSFTMLTINADEHPLMRKFHKPLDEKRMVVMLPESAYDTWLGAKPVEAMGLMQPCPADRWVADAAAPDGLF